MSEVNSRVRVVRRGAGSPLVFLHGIGHRRQAFDPILDDLARTHEVITFDLPGFGATPVYPAIQPSIDGYAAFIADVLAELEIESPHVVGNSLGGGIALELGRARIAGAVTAFSPAGFWTRPELLWCQRSLATVRAAATAARPAFAAGAATVVGRTALFALIFGKPWRVPAEVTMADVDALVAAPAFTRACALLSDYDLLTEPRKPQGLDDIPVTIAWGSRDGVLPAPRQSRAARAALPHSRHLRLPGCGHVPFYDDPDLCADIVRFVPSRPDAPDWSELS